MPSSPQTQHQLQLDSQPQSQFHSSPQLQLPQQFSRESHAQPQPQAQAQPPLQLLLQPELQFQPQNQPSLQTQPYSQSQSPLQQFQERQQRPIYQPRQLRAARQPSQHQPQISAQVQAQSEPLPSVDNHVGTGNARSPADQAPMTSSVLGHRGASQICPQVADLTSLSRIVVLEGQQMPSLKRSRSPDVDPTYQYMLPAVISTPEEGSEGPFLSRNPSQNPAKRIRAVPRSRSMTTSDASSTAGASADVASSVISDTTPSSATSAPSTTMPMTMSMTIPASISGAVPTVISSSIPSTISGCAPLSAIVSTPTMETANMYNTYQSIPPLATLYPQSMPSRIVMEQQPHPISYISTYIPQRLPSMAHPPAPGPTPTSAASVPPTKPTKPPVVKSLPTVRDHTTSDVCPTGDEYIPREFDEEGEKKVLLNGQLTGTRQYLCKTFHLPRRADKLFMLATECARVLGYRDSYLLFNKNRSLYKMIANPIEKEELVRLSIIPYSYRSRQIALVSARSMFRQFGSRVIVNGHRVRDDYWVAKAIKQGFTEDELSSDKRPGAAKARAAEAAAAAEEAAAQAAAEHQHVLIQSGHHDLAYGHPVAHYPGPSSHYLHSVLPLPSNTGYYDHPILPSSVTQDYTDSRTSRQELAGQTYHDPARPNDYSNHSQQTYDMERSASQSRDIRGSYNHDVWRRSHNAHAASTQPPPAIEPVPAPATVASSTSVRCSPQSPYGAYTSTTSGPPSASASAQSPSMIANSPYPYTIQSQAPTAQSAMRASMPALQTTQTYTYPPPTPAQVWQQTVPQTPQSSYSGYTTQNTPTLPDQQSQPAQQQYSSLSPALSARMSSARMHISSMPAMGHSYTTANHSIYPPDQTPRQYLPPVSQGSSSSAQTWSSQSTQPVQSGEAYSTIQESCWQSQQQ
ncbi:hypothetical protein BROUX41_001451 [Berkeleyomyces rouxiae]|uniref:uncharacterized protein n=1 Tax=Berkeleyomyces rouxiae TaxID=2035830 RepID=UPI003B7A5F3E